MVVVTLTDCPPKLRGDLTKVAYGDQYRSIRWKGERKNSGNALDANL